MKRILIKNAHIINANNDLHGDILISDGIIERIEGMIPESICNTTVIDAANQMVLPGGVDPHVHLDLPTPAGNSSDNFRTGSIAAISGGTTSIIDFVTPVKGESLIKALYNRKEIAKASLIDYSFHMGVTWWSKYVEDEIKQCIEEEGITSFKTYLAYKGGIGIEYEELDSIMNTVGKMGGLVTVHCEEGDKILSLQKKFIPEGKTSAIYHALSRPANTESESVKKVLELAAANKCPVYLVHISTKESLNHIIQARELGQLVFVETCPHYLLLDDSNYERPGPEGLKYIMSPPLRKKEDQDALWKAMDDDLIQTVGTDHCPFNLTGQKDIGINDFSRVPNGVGGIENRLSLLYTYGVLTKKISLNRMVELCCTNPAKIFGLKRKGMIAEGLDADLVIWNTQGNSLISATNQWQRCDYSIYEGFRVSGIPETIIVNGDICFQKNNLISEPAGRFYPEYR